MALAEELAMLTGESLEAAVVEALRLRIIKERQLHDRLARVMSIAAEIRAHKTGPMPSADMAEFYDENGLPR